MKKTLLFSALLLTLFACNISSEQDYKAIAKDTCNCVNLITNDLSPGMIEVIEACDGDEKKLEAGMIEYMGKDPVQGMKDVQILQGGESMDKMTTCMEEVEKKYNDVYTTLSEQEILDKMVAQLKTIDGCQSSIAILKMGMAAR